MRNYRPNIAALLTFAVLAASCSPPAGGPVVVAQSPPMPVVVPVVPTPDDKPDPPKPDTVSGITIPPQTNIDQRLIATFCPPPGLENAEATWRFFEVAKEGWMRPVVIDALIDSGGQRAFLWPKPGNYRAEVICQGTVWTADFTRGDPAPPEPSKTLKQLAGPDAAALSAIYQSIAEFAKVNDFQLVGIFTAFCAEKTKAYAANPAVIEVAKRFAGLGAPDEKVDAKQIGELLASVVRELDAPGPAPGPTPVEPGPGTPVSFDGLHVIIVEESDAKTLWLYDMVASAAVQTYLDTKCAGGKAGWRRWDQNTPTTNVPPNLKELFALPKPSVPCVIIANNKRANVLPLTKDTTDTAFLSLLKQHGGE